MENHTNHLHYFASYAFDPQRTGSFNVCYYDANSVSDNTTHWKRVLPWDATTSFIPHWGFMILLIRTLSYLFKLVGQPRFLAQIIAAIMVGPVVFGSNELYVMCLRPVRNSIVLETVVNFGIVYYMFLVGLEMDLSTLRKIDKKAICNALVGIVIPSNVGVCLYYMLKKSKPNKNEFGSVIWGASLTVTSFPDLARVLSDVKLLHTDIGRMALSSGVVNDLATWIFFVVTIVSINHGVGAKLVFVFLTFLAFALFCWFAVRPMLLWAIANTSTRGGNYTNKQIYCILSGLLIFGFITDAFGSYSMVGAFMFGLMIQKSDIRVKIIEKLENFVINIMLPLFFTATGSRISMPQAIDFKTLIAIVVLACSAKIVSGFLVSKFCGIPAREAIGLGVLMNTKGILAVIILNVGRDTMVLDNLTFSVMFVVFIAMTILVKPVTKFVFKSTRRFKPYKRRTVEKIKIDSELRVLACIHTTYNLSGMISLLEFSNATWESRICMFALHLVELGGHATTAMLIIHDSHQFISRSHHVIDHEEAKLDDILRFLEDYEIRSQGLSVQPMTVVSRYSTMHGDICNIAVDKLASIILIPFHRQASDDEVMEERNYSIRAMNQHLLTRAPCSVAIFIDRGLSSYACNQGSNHDRHQLRCAMIFTGGPDNREALAFSERIIGSGDVHLTVTRFIPGQEAEHMMKGSIEAEIERRADDVCLGEFRFKTMCNSSIKYAERVANTGEEILTTIKTILDKYDLFILGKGKGVIEAFTMGLSEWDDACEELGPLGDALSTSIFAKNASIIVIQQFKAIPLNL